MVMAPEGFSHWGIHSTHGWPSWLTLCFLTLSTKGTERENSDLCFCLVPAAHVPREKEKMLLTIKLQFCPSDFPVLYHWHLLTAPRRKTPLVGDAFLRKKCCLLGSLLSTQGVLFSPIPRQISAAELSKDFMQHNWNVSEECIYSLPTSEEVYVRCLVLWSMLFCICIKKTRSKMPVQRFKWNLLSFNCHWSLFLSFLPL